MSTPKYSENNNQIKSHNEILEIIDEIKIFENNFIEFKLKVEEPEEELIEVKNKYEEPAPIGEEPIYKYKIKRSKKKDRPSATFKIRFNEKGELINLDFKKPKVKPEIEKKAFSMKKILLRKKSQDIDKTSGSKDKSTKSLKLKERLKRFSKLKNVIPNKFKKNDESEELNE
jgi:hypothetical protein